MLYAYQCSRPENVFSDRDGGGATPALRLGSTAVRPRGATPRWQCCWDGEVAPKATRMARTWRAHGKNMAKEWQEHGKNMASAWQGVPGTCPLEDALAGATGIAKDLDDALVPGTCPLGRLGGAALRCG